MASSARRFCAPTRFRHGRRALSWAIDDKSKGAHCWGEFFLDGVGWVPYDTTIGDTKKSDEFFAIKKGEHIAGMIDFDWVIDAGPFGKQTAFGIDAFPAFWGQGKGDMNNAKLDTTTSVRIEGPRKKAAEG